MNTTQEILARLIDGSRPLELLAIGREVYAELLRVNPRCLDGYVVFERKEELLARTEKEFATTGQAPPPVEVAEKSCAALKTTEPYRQQTGGPVSGKGEAQHV